MIPWFKTEAGSCLKKGRHGLLATIVLGVLCVSAREATLPALAMPTRTPSRIEPVAPSEVLAPVATTRVTTLTRIKSGLASWYGAVLHGHRTASGRRFNMYELTAAHRDLPFGSKVKVTDLRNQRSVVVTITDRGVLDADRVIDLSYGAAKQLQMLKSGVDPVTLEVMTAGNLPIEIK